jgi:RNA polymerase sigma-70 factor (family 1)
MTNKEIQWFRQVFDDYYKSVRNYIYYLSSDIELSEDLVQDVFLKLWEKQNNIEEKTVKSLLFTIARNLYYNHHKRKTLSFKFTNSYIEKVETESPEFLLEMKEFDQRLQHAIGKLPEKCRVYFLLNRIDGLKYNEISVVMKVSEKAVEKQISKALRLLKALSEHKI